MQCQDNRVVKAWSTEATASQAGVETRRHKHHRQSGLMEQVTAGAFDASALDCFTALLGEDVFFVPCARGTKKPLITYVERPFESTKGAPYQAIFNAEPTNIAVYLGKASGGLCAIDLDDD